MLIVALFLVVIQGTFYQLEKDLSIRTVMINDQTYLVQVDGLVKAKHKLGISLQNHVYDHQKL